MSKEVAGVRSVPWRVVGAVGAVLGTVAAGVVAGVAGGHTLVSHYRRAVADPYADEPFGQLPYDESLQVTTRDGADLHVEVVEPADGVELEADFAEDVVRRPLRAEPAVVFVPGFCLDMGAFYFQRKELTQRGDWRTVYYDQPGHGRSSAVRQGEHKLTGLADALQQVLAETVPRGPIVLVGHSMGSMTIMAFAQRYPQVFADRVAGVALISSAAGRPESLTHHLPEQFSRLARPLLPVVDGATRVAGGLVYQARRAASDLAWLLTRRYAFGTDQPSPALVSYVAGMSSRTDIETVVQYLRTLYHHAQYPTLATLRDKPVLLIYGDRDEVIPTANPEEIKSRLPAAELVVVPGSGHMVLLEHAPKVNQALITFLERIG